MPMLLCNCNFLVHLLCLRIQIEMVMCTTHCVVHKYGKGCGLTITEYQSKDDSPLWTCDFRRHEKSQPIDHQPPSLFSSSLWVFWLEVARPIMYTVFWRCSQLESNLICCYLCLFSQFQNSLHTYCTLRHESIPFGPLFPFSSFAIFQFGIHYADGNGQCGYTIRWSTLIQREN